MNITKTKILIKNFKIEELNFLPNCENSIHYSNAFISNDFYTIIIL
jgi:hypothetical protein